MAPSTDDDAGKTFRPPPAGMGALYVARGSGMPGIPAVNISVASKMVGSLTDYTWFRVELPPGNYDVRASGRDGSGSLDISLTAGQTRYLAVKEANWAVGGTVTELPLDQGRLLVMSGQRAREIR
jgi:hypothetical protein